MNVDYFKNPFDRNACYIFGFWSIKENSDKVFDITVKRKDKFIMKKIKEILGYDEEICQGQQCIIHYENEEMNNDLIKFNVPHYYLSDFLRGCFDRSGDVLFIKRNRKNLYFNCQNKDFADRLQYLILTEIGVTGSYDNKNKVLKFGTKASLEISKYIYKDSPELFLLRKRQKINS